MHHVLDAIGNTPLVQLRNVVPRTSARVLVKLEFANPTGSMKDRMAKAAIETACWDMEAKRLGVPLWRHLGGTQREIRCGVSIGIQDSVEQLLAKIETELAAGYRRIKVKVKPGWDVDVLERIRARWPDILLSCDANSADWIAANTPRIYQGTHLLHHKVKFLRGRSVKVETEDLMYLQAEGELLGEAPTTFTILPNLLKVLM